MNFNELKNNISLNLISFFGYAGFCVLIYYIFFSLIMHGKLSFFPRMTLEHACAYLTASVLLFFFFAITAIMEPFFIKILKINNKDVNLKKYLAFVPVKFFIIGLIIALLGVIFYLCFAIPAISLE